MLKIESIDFSFPNSNLIFNSFSLTLTKGEIVSLVGNSGSGKSTLFNLIAGIFKPQSGKILFNCDYSYLTQVPTLLPYRTSFENALLACELRNILDSKKLEQASFLFKSFNLDEKSKSKFPNELSGGMRQRVGLIQTLLVDSELFLLDEPFNAIDRSTSLTIQNYVWERFKVNRTSAIIVTHDLDQSILTSDKILLMSNRHNQYKEIIFDKYFTSLSPSERINTEYYNEYLIQIIKYLNEQ